MAYQFISKTPELDEYWRSIILFGRNVASYKFALAKSLLELKPRAGELVKLIDLAPVFAKHVAEHVKQSPKQTTSSSSTFLETCEKFNNGIISADELSKTTAQIAFVNVIDAFHVVAQSEVEKRFFIDERKERKGICITDEFEELYTSIQGENLMHEVESRWRLVETAWELGISQSVLSVHHEFSDSSLFVLNNVGQRIDVTSSSGALNGYQKGACFYCFGAILIGGSDLSPDVDHFFPHKMKRLNLAVNIDGIWNLVLACRDCNRGVGGKFDRIPRVDLVERLMKRNEFLISSHHPLRETLMAQMGQTEQLRVSFLNHVLSEALFSSGFGTWAPKELKGPPRF